MTDGPLPDELPAQGARRAPDNGRIWLWKDDEVDDWIEAQLQATRSEMLAAKAGTMAPRLKPSLPW